jgi:predicted secreted hydrolase
MIRVRMIALGALAFLALLVSACGLPGTIPQRGHIPTAAPAPTATPLPPPLFPQDEAPHHNLTEWWYYTGHFAGKDTSGHQHQYGFELVFFQNLRGQVPPYYAAHFAISDLTRGEFHYDQQASLTTANTIPPAGSTKGFDVSLGAWEIKGLGGHDVVAATQDGYQMSLSLSDTLPHPVLHGGSGIITYGQAGYSYYYSRPRMRVSGSIVDHGATVPVSGVAWMDHQWGDFVSLAGTGWDWFSIQLSDGTSAMLYVIRDAQKKPLSTVGTFIAADGTVSDIPADGIQLSATGSWTSPHTQGIYPSGWKISLPGLQTTLTETPALLDQELDTARSTGVAYWEGAVHVAGTVHGKAVTGQGYTELTGYATVRPAIGSPAAG